MEFKTLLLILFIINGIVCGGLSVYAMEAQTYRSAVKRHVALSIFTISFIIVTVVSSINEVFVNKIANIIAIPVVIMMFVDIIKERPRKNKFKI